MLSGLHRSRNRVRRTTAPLSPACPQALGEQCCGPVQDTTQELPLSVVRAQHALDHAIDDLDDGPALYWLSCCCAQQQQQCLRFHGWTTHQRDE